MNKKTNKANEIKYFIIHKDNILRGNFNEDTKMYFDISKTETIKDLIEVIKENLIKFYENQKYKTKEDIETYKKYMNKKGVKAIIKDIEDVKYILYKEETRFLKDGKIIKYEPQEIIIETMFERLFK